MAEEELTIETMTNQQLITHAAGLMNRMHALVQVYERGVVNGPQGLVFQLDAGQVTQLKQAFAAARAECIAALQAITG